MTLAEHKRKYGVTKEYKRVLRNRIILGTIATLIIVGISTGVVKTVNAAYREKYSLSTYMNENESIYYTSVMVHGGDTLTSIANDIIEEYNMDIPTDVIIQNIFSLNNMTNPDYIKAGCYLVVPYIDVAGKE